MGICSSCEGTTTSLATTKVILQDGQLQEFPYPVKVSEVLQNNSTCFICNSDDMDFDDSVSAISEEEILQPGQLYFALPLSKLKHPLQAEEMAVLAVKASLAFRKNGLVLVAFPGKREVKRLQCSGGEGLVAERRRRSSVGICGSGRGRKFVPLLSAIKE